MRKLIRFATIAASVMLLTACGHEHTFSAATCTQPATCTECGETQGETIAHNYSDATCEKPKTCKTCGATVGVKASHFWEDATCEKPKTCSKCGATSGSKSEHSWEEATCDTPKTCKLCGQTEGTSLGHDYSKGSCTKTSVCSRCGSEIAAPGHKYAAATCLEAAKCTVCGEVDKNSKPLGHNLVNGSCTRCDYSLGDLDAIAEACSTKALCETDLKECKVRTTRADGNPYDVVYDYGEAYNALIAQCDFSLIFDVEYYKKTFPMLALQYHYDDDLLLEHFKTVGIHEGRQGSEKFCVTAYFYNCADPVYDAFKTNWAAYYIYYLLNYETEKNVNTVSNADHKMKKQQKIVRTAAQIVETNGVNKYRQEVEVEDVTFDSELAALANYRAYVNAHDGYKAHDWTIENDALMKSYFDLICPGSKGGWEHFAENTYTTYTTSPNMNIIWADKYRDSEKHYKAMVDKRNHFGGFSNMYIGNSYSSQFDLYISKVDTPANPLEK